MEEENPEELLERFTRQMEMSRRLRTLVRECATAKGAGKQVEARELLGKAEDLNAEIVAIERGYKTPTRR